MIAGCVRRLGCRSLSAWLLAVSTALVIAAGEVGGAELPREFEPVADSIASSSQVFAGTGAAHIAVIQPFEGSDRERMLLSQLDEALRTRWKGVSVAQAGEVTAAAKRLVYSVADLETRPEARASVMRSLGLSQLVFLLAGNREDRVEITSRTAHAASGEMIERRWAVAKNDDVRVYLGEPVPAYVSITVPEESQLYLDGQALGTGSREPRLVRVPRGAHEFKVTKPGFAPYEAFFSVSDAQRLSLGARERNNSGAPVGAMLCSAVLPGLGLLLYGAPHTARGKYTVSDGVAGVGAIGFYTFGAVWLTDVLANEEFTTKESLDRTKTIKQVELLLAAGSYVVNVLGSFAVGADFAAKNRQLVRARVASVHPNGGARWMPLLGVDHDAAGDSRGARAGVAVRF